MNEMPISNPAAPPWEVQFIQLSVFPTASPMAIDQEWFGTFVDGAADDMESVRKKDSLSYRRSEKGRVLDLTMEPLKITWLEMAPFSLESPEEVPDRFPTLGLLPAVQDRFVTLMHRWLPLCPPTWRVGLGAKLVIPTSGRVDSYRLLSRFMHFVRVEPEESSDMNFRINRRRSSTAVPGVEINRLTSWAAPRIDVSFATRIPGREAVPLSESALNAASVELDINTSPEHNQGFALGELPRLLDEFSALATEIADKGDVK